LTQFRLITPGLIAGAMLVVSPGHAVAASGNTATAPGSAAAAVIAPIVLVHTSGASLSFGSLTVGTGGVIVVTPAGVGSVVGTVTLVSGRTVSADAFSVSGDPSRNFSITTSFGSVTSGSGSMVFATTPSATQATLGATGTGTFTVGGTLAVGSNVTPGVYTGTYTATVTYD
jgi:hypothetical protein